MRALLGAVFCLLWLTPVAAAEISGSVSVQSAAGPAGSPPPGSKPFIKKNKNLDLSQVVVFLDRPPKKVEKRAVIHQRERRFIPFVSVVQAGSTIAFPNEDLIYHSVYSESPARVFQLEEYPQGESRDVIFNDAGHVELYCAIHTRMNAHILVLDHRMFVRPDSQGRFAFPGMKPGKYRVTAWHPLWGEQTVEYELKKEGSRQLDMVLGAAPDR